MSRQLEQALEDGAWGYSTGLEYAAESGVPEEEIETLCRVVARHRALYATHTRDRDAQALEAVEEAIRTAERTGVRLQVSHLVPRSGFDAAIAASRPSKRPASGGSTSRSTCTLACSASPSSRRYCPPGRWRRGRAASPRCSMVARRASG